MALGHVYQSNHTTQISVAKIKRARVLAAAGRHNMRDKARLGKKEANHIDLARTHLNQTIGRLYRAICIAKSCPRSPEKRLRLRWQRR